MTIGLEEDDHLFIAVGNGGKFLGGGHSQCPYLAIISNTAANAL
jgi:hypothetical protein